MGLAAKKLRMTAPAAGGGAFDPETDITWHSLFWTEGTAFTALGLSDTDAVPTWPNETSETDLTTAIGSDHTYASSDARFNNRPVVTSVAGNGMAAAVTTQAQPLTLVLIAAAEDVDLAFRSLRGDAGTTDAIRMRAINTGGGRVRLEGSVAITTSTDFLTNTTATAHLTIGIANGASSELIGDGTSLATGDVGTGSVSNLTINRTGAANGMPLTYAFAAMYDGDFTADAAYADFETWVTDHYGITIA